MGSLLLMGVGGRGGPGAGVWVTSFSQTLNIDSANWNGNNLRMCIFAAVLTQSGSKTRLTLQSGSGAEGAAISEAWIGHQSGSDQWDAGTLTQITVGASTSFTIPANTSVVTDEINFALDETQDIVVTFYFNSAANDTLRGRNLVVSTISYFKAAASEASVGDVTGYSGTNQGLRLISTIEVLQP